ncbi:hypothetical protein BG011_007154 [Mortierella polycephala]|uniref:PH domain-containing protein n=1 Tax=Mortierella polycephala TaxID=41804 RepID=A0A9P6U8X3_9FUNG|nr:hypothetical protein BG011_007154 [Mortierella polycephala]
MAESVAEAQLSPQQLPGQPLAASTTSTSLANLQTVAQARAELEARLAGINDDLQLTQTIGLLFVKRQADLKNCFQQLQRLDEQQLQHASDNEVASEGNDGLSSQPLPETFREQLATMDKEFQEGQNGIAGLKGMIDAQLPPSTSSNDLATSRSSSVLGPSAFPSSTLPVQTISKPRRHKVVMSSAPSVNDAAFPLQIQEELLNQVRYWTSQAEMKEKLNQEYDTKINEQERIIDALNKQRRLREEGEERQKEDQWNLELQNQELRNQNTDLHAQLSKAIHENTKIQKSFATAMEQVEQLKDKEEMTASQLELTKTKHEQDMVSIRKHVSGIQREKSELLTKVEDLNASLTIQQQKIAKKATQEAIARAQEQEDTEDENSVDGPVLIQAPGRVSGRDEAVAGVVSASTLEPKVASLARETSFAHQQSIISELQTKLSQEITQKEELVSQKEELLVEKEELAKMLADREETIEALRFEGVSRQSSEMGIMDDTEDVDHRDLSMTLSENDSHDFSTGRASPFPTGGLFAELAQATSQSNVKAPTEYKDQEVMTDPIESWIHTVPGIHKLLSGTSHSQESSTDTSVEETLVATETKDELPAVTKTKDELPAATKTKDELPAATETKDELPVATETKDELPVATETKDELPVVAETKDNQSVATITGKPGTETKRISTISTISASSSPIVDSLGINAATETIQEEQEEEQDEEESEIDVASETASVSKEISTESETTEPVSGDLESSTEDERRHTCDLSQTLVEQSTPPPVPELPAEHASERPSLKSGERATKVSFGSAFGGDYSTTDTGRIRSIYTDGSQQVDTQSDTESDTRSDTQSEGQSQVEQQSAAVPAAENRTDIPSSSVKHAKASSSTEHGIDTESPAAKERAIEQEELEEQSAADSVVPLTVAAATVATAAAVATAATSAVASQDGTPSSHTEVATQRTTPEKNQHQEAQIPGQKEHDPSVPLSTVVSVSSHATHTYENGAPSEALHPQLDSDIKNHQHHIITDSTGATIGRNNIPTPNGSISTMSTDYNHGGRYRDGRRMSIGSNYDITPTDPTMIQLITQTMIGDYLWKHTRRRMMMMVSEKRHRRYVWVHPYTKTIYWSQSNPGAENSREQKAKSALIVSVFQVTDEHNNLNSDSPNVSLLVQTANRNLKLTAPTREKHELWFQSISYLLSRPSTPGADTPSDNQTWSEVQASNSNGQPNPQQYNHARSLSLGGPISNSSVMNLRQGDRAVRKKGSFPRLQSMFGRGSIARESTVSPSPPTYSSMTASQAQVATPVTAVGSPRIGASGVATSMTSLNSSRGGVLSSNGHGNGNGSTHNVIAYPGPMAKNAPVGGNGIVNGGSILAQAQAQAEAEAEQKNGSA